MEKAGVKKIEVAKNELDPHLIKNDDLDSLVRALKAYVKKNPIKSDNPTKISIPYRKHNIPKPEIILISIWKMIQMELISELIIPTRTGLI